MRAAFAISLAAALGALSALSQTPATDLPYGGVQAGDVSLFAVAEQDLVAVEWRFLDDGDGALDTSPPDFSLAGFGDLNGSATRFADDGDLVLAFAVSGETETDVAGQILLANAVMTSLSAVEADWLLVDAAQSGEIAFEGAIPTDTPFAPLETLDAFEPGPASPQGLQGAFAALAGQDMEGSGRKALFAPGRLFPADPGIQAAVVQAALQENISIFPISDDAQLGLMALQTGGMALPAVGDVHLGKALELFLSGGTVVIDLPEHRQYRLPNEPAAPLTLHTRQGTASADLSLMHPAATLTNGELATRFVDPRHWGGWVATPGRRVLGLGAFGLTALVLFGLGLIARRQILRRWPQAAELESQPVAPYVPASAGPWTIGRREGHPIRLADASVSRDHARLEATSSGAWKIVDLGSSNGTFVEDGAGWTKTTTAELETEDRIRFGGVVHTIAELLALSRGEFAPVRMPVDADSESGLARFKAPRRNPITGEIEEGA